jgi:hypothetical protein
MLGMLSCDVWCMVKFQPLSCILDLSIDDICKYFYWWLLDLRLGARCGIILDDVIILCGINFFYMMCTLRRMATCMGVGFTLKEDH